MSGVTISLFTRTVSFPTITVIPAVVYPLDHRGRLLWCDARFWLVSEQVPHRLKKLRKRLQVVVCAVVLFILTAAFVVVIHRYQSLAAGFKCIRDQFPFGVLLYSQMSVFLNFCIGVYLIWVRWLRAGKEDIPS